MRRPIAALACLLLLSGCFGSYLMDVAAADMIGRTMDQDQGDQPAADKGNEAQDLPETLPEDPDCC